MCYSDCSQRDVFSLVTTHSYYRQADPAFGVVSGWARQRSQSCRRHLASKIDYYLDVDNRPAVFTHVKGVVSVTVTGLT